MGKGGGGGRRGGGGGGRVRGRGGPLRREGNERCPDRNTEVSHFLSGDRSEDTGGYKAELRGGGGGGTDHRKGYKQAPLNTRERGQIGSNRTIG